MEDDGILVSRNSVVGNSTARRLDVGEFRGFTIEDDGYVLVFVNTADAKTAQLFSLAHELGHEILGRTGISDHSEHVDIERWCNRFAAAVIAPAETVEHPFTDADLHEGGAPPFDVVVRSRAGGRFFDTVTHVWSHGQITERDAARYLGASSYDSLSKLARA